MIRVTVELLRGGVGPPREIGSAIIANDMAESLLTEGRRGSYRYSFFGKRGRLLKDAGTGQVTGFPRGSKNVWHLVARCLKEAGYR